MDWGALVANFGGVFGLFMGGSILSVVEIVYYFSIKLFAIYFSSDQRKVKSIKSRKKSGIKKYRRPIFVVNVVENEHQKQSGYLA